VTVFFDT